jgi:hypothetical protein
LDYIQLSRIPAVCFKIVTHFRRGRGMLASIGAAADPAYAVNEMFLYKETPLAFTTGCQFGYNFAGRSILSYHIHRERGEL